MKKKKREKKREKKWFFVAPVGVSPKLRAYVFVSTFLLVNIRQSVVPLKVVPRSRVVSHVCVLTTCRCGTRRKTKRSWVGVLCWSMLVNPPLLDWMMQKELGSPDPRSVHLSLAALTSCPFEASGGQPVLVARER